MRDSNDDLIATGMQADAIRKRWHPEGIVSYTLESSSPSTGVAEMSLTEADFRERLAQLEPLAIRVVRMKPLTLGSLTAVEGLQLIALARIQLQDVREVEVSGESLGLKFSQIALRFGVNDLGKVGSGVSEEQIRRLIRDAGFTPKRRDGNYNFYELN